MNAEKPIELRKVGFRQTKDGDVISFALHPDEDTEHLSLPKVGARFGAVIVQLSESEERIAPPQNKTVQRAAILCGNPEFEDFLSETWPSEYIIAKDSPERAAETLRLALGIKSRKELAHNMAASEQFEQLMVRFENWKHFHGDAA